MNQKQLEKKVKYWQKILKLDHWEISCGLADHETTDGRLGTSSSQPEYFSSHIKIMDPKFYIAPEEEDPIDRIIIHELLHCHLKIACPDKEPHERDEVERVITYLERAIYDLWAGEE